MLHLQIPGTSTSAVDLFSLNLYCGVNGVTIHSHIYRFTVTTIFTHNVDTQADADSAIGPKGAFSR